MLKRLLSRRWVRWGVLPLLALMLLAVVGLTVLWFSVRMSGEQLRDQVAKNLDASDPGWRLDQLEQAYNASLPPPERNAAERVRQAQEKLPKSCRDWINTHPLHDGPLGHLPSDEHLEGVRRLCDDASESLAIAHTIRRLPAGGCAITFDRRDPLGTLLPGRDESRRVSALLQLNALRLATSRRGDEALESTLGIVATARASREEPLFISQLVGFSHFGQAQMSVERVLSLSEPGEATLAELQSSLANEVDRPTLAIACRGERAMLWRLFDSLDEGGITLDTLEASPKAKPDFDPIGRLTLRAILPGQYSKFFELMNRLVELSRLSPDLKRQRQLALLEMEINTVPKKQYPLIVLFPGYQRFEEAEVRTAANLRVAVIALECERFRLKELRYPKDLNELKPVLPANLLKDPYAPDGQIHYRLTDEGAVVYSVGPDEQDDEGEVIDYSTMLGDLRFQLFLPEHRRKPPVPKPVAADPEH